MRHYRTAALPASWRVIENPTTKDRFSHARDKETCPSHLRVRCSRAGGVVVRAALAVCPPSALLWAFLAS